MTFFWKFIFPGVIGASLVVGLIQTIIRSELDLKAVSAFVFLSLALTFVYWMVGSLKSVHLEGNSLHVSNYFRKISVPLSNIAVVNDPDKTSHSRIFVSFVSPMLLGEEIVFVPPLFEARSTASLLQNRVDSDKGGKP